LIVALENPARFRSRSAARDDIQYAFLDGEYQLVYTFELPSDDLESQLEEVFFQSQNLEEAWNEESPCRSTSVGDVVRFGNTYWIVAGQGFHKGWQD